MCQIKKEKGRGLSETKVDCEHKVEQEAMNEQTDREGEALEWD